MHSWVSPTQKCSEYIFDHVTGSSKIKTEELAAYKAGRLDFGTSLDFSQISDFWHSDRHHDRLGRLNDDSVVTDGSMLYSLPRFCLVHDRFLCEWLYGGSAVTNHECVLCDYWQSIIQRLSIKTHFRLSVSPGSAEALVMWGGKIKYHLTANFLSNISAKNYQDGRCSSQL